MLSNQLPKINVKYYYLYMKALHLLRRQPGTGKDTHQAAIEETTGRDTWRQQVCGEGHYIATTDTLVWTKGWRSSGTEDSDLVDERGAVKAEIVLAAAVTKSKRARRINYKSC